MGHVGPMLALPQDMIHGRGTRPAQSSHRSRCGPCNVHLVSVDMAPHRRGNPLNQSQPLHQPFGDASESIQGATLAPSEARAACHLSTARVGLVRHWKHTSNIEQANFTDTARWADQRPDRACGHLAQPVPQRHQGFRFNIVVFSPANQCAD